MEELGQRPAPPAPPSEHDSELSALPQPALGVCQTTGIGRNDKKLGKTSPMPNMKRRNSLSNSDTSSQVSQQLPAAVVGSIGPPKLQRSNTSALLPKTLSGKDKAGSNASGSVSDATGKGSGKDRAGKRSTSKEPPQERRPSKTALHLLQNPVPVVPERIVVAIDLSWIKMHFSGMSQQRLKIYALLHAIGDCAADNFNTVVGLFTSVMVEVDGEDSDAEETRSTADYGSQGAHYVAIEKQPMSPGERMVGAIEIVDSLRKLHVSHPWTVVDVEDFVLTLVEEEGKIRLLDLEKTAGRIREDAQRRSTSELALLGLQVDRTWLTSSVESAPGNNFNQGGIPAQAALGAGSLSLGDQARHIENEAGWLIKDEVTKKFAFNSACFMECMFRIAFRYLHSTAVPAHSAMPAGPKAVWLMTFLHHRFDHLLGVHQATIGCKSQRSTEASTRPWTPESPALDNPLFRPPSAGTISSSSLPAHNAGWADQQANKVDWVAKRPNSSASRRDLLSLGPDSPKLPKPDSTYMSKKGRILEDYPSLFESLPWLPNSRVKRPLSGAGKRPQSGTGNGRGRRQSGTAPPDEESVASNLLALEICHNCKRKRNADGVGNIHCHACSGITSISLKRNPMWPVIYHRKLHRERSDLFHFGEEGDALSDINSQKERKDDLRLGSNRQGSKVVSELGSQIGDKAASVNSDTSLAESDGGLVQKASTLDRRLARTSATVEMKAVDHPGHHQKDRMHLD